jgi:hypothetical protein
MKYPKVLLISNLYDFSTDFVAVELDKQKIDYIRINRDELKNYLIEFNPIIPEIVGEYQGHTFTLSTKYLQSIYYRAPTFLRDIFQEGLTENEQLIRTQWTAFVRSLCVFDKIKWLNNPVYIYQAEIKPYQLYLANKLGIKVPKSIISNKMLDIGCEHIAIKSIDTAIVSKGDEEGFVYTEIYTPEEINELKYTSPFFNQEGLVPKIDIRVTVVEENVVAVKILSEKGIDQDWRRFKNELEYIIFELPVAIKDFCVEYVKSLNLKFGAIDLILHKDVYYFIEINPTGEWSWLQQNTGYKFDELIVKSLINE